MQYLIAYDFGTTGVKTCLFGAEQDIRLIASAYAGYGLYILPDGGAEQDADEWWDAMCRTTKAVFEKTDVTPAQVTGISFCSQMQGMVLVDEYGRALRRPMSYMDQRASAEFKACQTHGPCVSGVNIGMLLRSLRATHAASTSVKDPLWKYKWVQAHEPEIFQEAHKWLDVKESLIARATGEFVMTRDSAYSTFLYDTRPGHEGWNEGLCRMYGVETRHLAKIIECTDVAGLLTEQAARELGLCPGTRVYGGGGDATLIGVGAGCTAVGSTHIYSGTSGWVETTVGKLHTDIGNLIGTLPGADPTAYNYVAEVDTSGKCMEWVKDRLDLPEMSYPELDAYIKDVPAGNSGVVFSPWMHGNRCPFEDANARGMFFNLDLSTRGHDLVKAVIEGVCMHMRWNLEASEKTFQTQRTVRFTGGSAMSPMICQILADVLGRPVETIESPRLVGAMGAAALVAVGTGMLPDIREVKKLIRVSATYQPSAGNAKHYDRIFPVFQQLYTNNKKSYAALNAGADQH